MNDVKRITLAGPFMIDEGCYYRGFEDIMTSWDTFQFDVEEIVVLCSILRDGFYPDEFKRLLRNKRPGLKLSFPWTDFSFDEYYELTQEEFPHLDLKLKIDGYYFSEECVKEAKEIIEKH